MNETNKIKKSNNKAKSFTPSGLLLLTLSRAHSTMSRNVAACRNLVVQSKKKRPQLQFKHTPNYYVDGQNHQQEPHRNSAITVPPFFTFKHKITIFYLSYLVTQSAKGLKRLICQHRNIMIKVASAAPTTIFNCSMKQTH